MRKIKVYSTNGRTNIDIETEAIDFGGLKRDLSSNNISYDGMRAVIGENKNTLEVDTAMLPDGDFTLFLTPKKIKSGAGERVEYYSRIKDLISRDGDRAKNFFNSGKNYTNKPTLELEQLLSSYGTSQTSNSVTESLPTPPSTPVAPNVVESVKQTEQKNVSSESTVAQSINLNLVEEALGILNNIDEAGFYEEDEDEFNRAKFLLQSFLDSAGGNSIAEDLELRDKAAQIAREFGNMY